PYSARVCEIRSVLGARTVHNDDVAGLQRITTPAISHQEIRTAQFASPAGHISLLIFHIKINPCVGVDPVESRNGPFQLDGFRTVELRCKRMMKQHYK